MSHDSLTERTAAPATPALRALRPRDEERTLETNFHAFGQILYIGEWWRRGMSPDSPMASNTQFNAFEFSFYGASVRWISGRGPDHGFADVYLDGQLVETVDTYAPAPQTGHVAFERHDIPGDRLHKLRVVVRKQRHPQAIDCFQDLEGLEALDPVCFPVEIARARNAEYAVIRAGGKPQPDPAQWTPVALAASRPTTGVNLSGGPMKQAFERNIAYLKHCAASPTHCDGIGWTEWLPASSDGRMLMAAANTLRWEEHGELRTVIADILARVEAQMRADGFFNYYPEEDSFKLNATRNSERKNYDRVFWTRGLLAAGRIGYQQGPDLVRRMYDWFNQSDYLGDMLLGGNATNGTPGGALVHASPVGKPADLITSIRFFDQDYWIDRLSLADPLALSYYPGERVHCYELLGIETCLEHYLATGSTRYLDAALGGWEAYRSAFKLFGGATTIMEYDSQSPPKSYVVDKSLMGEACGSVFWINLNLRLLELFPDQEQYAHEIEESLFNVMLAAQDDGGNIIYHNVLSGHKQPPRCGSTCCEVTSTDLFARLPELIYSRATSTIFIHQLIASEFKLADADCTLTLSTDFPVSETLSLTVDTAQPVQLDLRIRIPRDLDGEVRAMLNGEVVATGTPGSYLRIDRLWNDRDEVSLVLKPALRFAIYEGVEQPAPDHDRGAFLYGPLLLALIEGDGSNPPSRIELTAADLIAAMTRLAGDGVAFGIAGYPDHRFIPYANVADEWFTCLPEVLSAPLTLGSTA